MAIYSGFSHKQMVIFHCYVSLPEGIAYIQSFAHAVCTHVQICIIRRDKTVFWINYNDLTATGWWLGLGYRNIALFQINELLDFSQITTLVFIYWQSISIIDMAMG